MKKNNKITHDYTCDLCNKPATYNLQQNWQEFEISPQGDFNEVNSWEGSENLFFCDACYQEEASRSFAGIQV